MHDSNTNKGNTASTTDLMNSTDNLLYGNGTPIDIGCSRKEFEKTFRRWLNKDLKKGLCAIASWQWWDIDMQENYFNNDTAALRPAVIYSDFVIADELDRYPQGGSVRTSKIVSIHENCVAETQNSFYLLVGSGLKKIAPIEIITSITF